MRLFTIILAWTNILVQNSNCQVLYNDTSPRKPVELPLEFVPSNTTSPRAGYGLIQFEGQNTPSDYVNFDDNAIEHASNVAIERPIKFDDSDVNFDKTQDEYNQNHITFGDNKKKRKKRRRRPKQVSGISKPGVPYQGGGLANINEDFGIAPNLNPGGQGPNFALNNLPYYGGPINANGLNKPGPQYNSQFNSYPNFGGFPNPNPALVRPGQYNGQPNYNPEFGGPYNPNTEFDRPGYQNNGANLYQEVGLPPYRPHRRPRPSLASQALSSVTGALTSIAAYDDYQCVPRLLCEAAGGGALGDSQIIQSASRLQPLLTVLSAYSGISTNPLFVFGRAVFLGASSKENPGSCRYAYPQCPTDTEQLVHYLNNHNGGFFRFFNNPQHGQQNLEQFYDQLSENYGLYQPNQISNQYGLPNTQNQQNYGFYKPTLYPMGQQQNYGIAYPYYNNQIQFKNTKVSNQKDNEIEKRILNKPDEDLFNDFENGQPTWTFPDNQEDNSIHDDHNIRGANNVDYNYDTRKGKTLRFPDQENVKSNYNNFNTNVREFVFPENEFNNYFNDYSSSSNSDDTFVFASRDTGIGNEYTANTPTNHFDDGSQTVYVVRGNGDPNNPEIVKLKPGQSIV